MKRIIFIGRFDEFSYTLIKKLHRDNQILWYCDAFSIYCINEKNEALSDGIHVHSYADKDMSHQEINDFGEAVWIYVNGTEKKEQIEMVLANLPAEKMSGIYIITTDDEYPVANEIIAKSHLGLRADIQYFIIPKLVRNGGNSILDEIVYQILQFVTMVTSRGHDLKNELVIISNCNRSINSLPVEIITDLIIELKDRKKKVFYIFDRENISLKDVLDVISSELGYTFSICEKNTEGLRFFDKLFDDMLQTCCHGLFVEDEKESDLSAGFLSCSKKERIIKAINKAKHCQKDVLYTKKSVKSVYADEINYYVTDKKPETLVIINAFGAHYNAWNRFISYMSKYFQVIVWEIPGCFNPNLYESEKGLYCINSQVEDIVNITNAEKLHSFHMLAWCSGVKASTIFACRYPDKVKSITFLSGDFAPYPNYNAASNKFLANIGMITEMIEKKSKLLSIYIKTISENSFKSDNSDKFFETVPIDMHNIYLEQYEHLDWSISFFRMCVEQYNHNVSPLLSELDIPILLIASQYDTVAPPEQTRWAATRIKNGKLVEIPMATHLVAAERPKEVAEIMEEFYRHIWNSTTTP